MMNFAFLQFCCGGSKAKKGTLREPLASADYLPKLDDTLAEPLMMDDSESVSLIVAFDFLEKGDSVLNAKAGEIAVALKEDWLRSDDAWVWVRIDDAEGWIPRSFLRLSR